MATNDLFLLQDSLWLSLLRQRFVEIAGRRVPESAVEDVVQDALVIILAKGPAQAQDAGQSHPSMRWSFNVLRNVIGNWYQKRRHHEEVDGLNLSEPSPDALAALTSEERVRTIRGAMQELKGNHPKCAQWLWSLAQGTKAAALALKSGIEPAAFYRRIYRCRLKLADILQRKGVIS